MKILSVVTIASVVICGLVLLPGLAQTPASGTSPANSLNMFAYARNGQNAEKQLKDENECFASAKQQTGIDPLAPPPAGKTDEQKAAEQKQAAEDAKTKKGGRARGAARGAAGGAAIGAIAGDAGTGAAVGAVAGTMKGGVQQRKAGAEAQKQAASSTAAAQQKEDEQINQEHAAKLDTFKRAFGACMDARGYSVK